MTVATLDEHGSTEAEEYAFDLEEVLYPEGEHFLESEEIKENREKEIETKLKNADTLVVTHNDLDGVGSGWNLNDWLENRNPAVIHTGYRSVLDLSEILALALDHDIKKLFVSDFGDNKAAELLNGNHEELEELVWVDHHEWDSEVQSELESLDNSSVVIDESVSAARLISQLRNGDHEAADEIPIEQDPLGDDREELMEIIDDHDRYVKTDPRSDPLAKAAREADPDELADILEYGLGLFDEFESELQEFVEKNDEKARFGIETAEQIEIEGITIAITYGNLPSTDIGGELLEGEIEMTVVVFPSGGLSFRSNEEAIKANEVASHFGGGGHPAAAGSGIDVFEFSEYRELWNQGIEFIKAEIVEAVEDELEA